MTQTPETLHPGLEGALGQIQTAELRCGANLAQAAKLQKRADSLAAQAPTLLDEPIQNATAKLIELAEAGEIDARDILVGALLINKYQPSGSLGKPIKKQDVMKTLQNYDALTPGTPVINVFRGPWDYYGGIVTDHPVSVIPSVGQGMGGRPEAEIRFGLKPIVFTGGEATFLRDEIQLVRFRKLQGYMIGIGPVQKLLDAQTEMPTGMPTHQRRRERQDRLIRYAKLGHLFNDALGTVVDVSEIDTIVEEELARLKSSRDIRRRLRPATFR